MDKQTLLLTGSVDIVRINTPHPLITSLQVQTYLVYEPYGTGHRMEYITNLLQCIQKEKNLKQQYVFAVPQSTVDQIEPSLRNIENTEIVAIHTAQPANVVSGSFQQYRTIRQLYKRFKFNHVLAIDFYPLTWAIIFKRHSFTISGILYKPFNPNELNSFTFSLSKNIQYWLLSRRKKLKSIFILNNPGLTEALNKKYRTDKFTDLTDPVAFYTSRNKNPYPDTDKITGLHFGSLDERKGTTAILESIPFIPSETRRRLVLAFIGRPSQSYKERLESLIDQTRNQYPELTILYNPEFVSNDEMEDYFRFADFVLLPYKYTNMSSGVLGHAAKWSKYLIGNKGLVGDLISHYQLGVSIYPFPKDIAVTITQYVAHRPSVNTESARQYIAEHSVEQFYHTLFPKA